MNMIRVRKVRAWVFDIGNPFVMVYGDDKKSELTLISNGDGFSVLDSDRETWIDEKYFEVMDFTGLIDKNLKEVYEGDIIKLKSYNYLHLEKEKFEVYFNIDTAQYMFRNNKPFPHNYNESIVGNYDIEVIGNIYQNPEILK